MKRKNFLGIFGHVNVDYIISVPYLPSPDTSIEINDLSIHFGGPCGNIAVLAAQLGVKVAIASFVGSNFPKEYYTVFKKSGVDITDLKIGKEYLTPTCFLISFGEKQIGLMNQGPMKDIRKYSVLSHTIDSSEIIHISTGRPEYYIKIIEYTKKKNKKISFDPGQEIHYVYTHKIFKKLIEKIDYFFASQAEYKTAKKYLNLKYEKDMINYVDTFILTRGANGSTIYTKENKIDIPAIRPKRIIDITGAGDAYRAGFYAGLYRRFSIEKCGLIGAIVSSYIISQAGPQIYNLKWKDIEEMILKYNLKY